MWQHVKECIVAKIVMLLYVVSSGISFLFEKMATVPEKCLCYMVHEENVNNSLAKGPR